MSNVSPSNVNNPATLVSINQPADSTRAKVQRVSELGGRILLSVLFLLSGLGKIGAYAGTAGYMSSFGVPGALLPVVIATEVLGALAVIVGWQTRAAAFLLAGFSLISAVIFHAKFSDQIQMIMFLKDVSIAGGFLLLVANGSGPLSIDRRLSK
jgi:putative oxidoreductase